MGAEGKREKNDVVKEKKNEVIGRLNWDLKNIRAHKDENEEEKVPGKKYYDDLRNHPSFIKRTKIRRLLGVGRVISQRTGLRRTC